MQRICWDGGWYHGFGSSGLEVGSNLNVVKKTSGNRAWAVRLRKVGSGLLKTGITYKGGGVLQTLGKPK